MWCIFCRCPGSKAGKPDEGKGLQVEELYWRFWTPSSHQCTQSTSPYDYLCRMSTKLGVRNGTQHWFLIPSVSLLSLLANLWTHLTLIKEMRSRCAAGGLQCLKQTLAGWNAFKLFTSKAHSVCSSIQELGLYQWVRLRVASWNLAWPWCSPLPSSLRRWSPLRCTTRAWRRLCRDTMLALTLRTWLSRTCGEGMWLATPSKILLQTLAALKLRLVGCCDRLHLNT